MVEYNVKSVMAYRTKMWFITSNVRTSVNCVCGVFLDVVCIFWEIHGKLSRCALPYRKPPRVCVQKVPETGYRD
jgi:hypothetical protein